jgi:regulator of protease activity HflC (stomatin/prohibitin superfamily)
MFGGEIALGLVILAGVVVLASFFIVQHDEAVILKRFGSFAEVCKSGVYFRLPLLFTTQDINWKFNSSVVPQTLKTLTGNRIPLRELRYDPIHLKCATQDNVYLEVDLVVKFVINKPDDACFKTINLFGDIEDAVLTNLYSTIAALPMASINPERVTAQLEKSDINKALAPLGTRVVTARVQSIELPKSIRQSTVLETADRMKREAELASLSQENAIRVRMAENELAKQRVEQERERETVEHTVRMEQIAKKNATDVQISQAKADSETKRIAAEQELKLLKDRHKEELEYRKALVDSDSDKLRREASILNEFPEAIEFFKSRHESTAWGQLAASSNSKLIFAPTGALDRAATLPVFRELSQVEGPPRRSRSPRRPAPPKKG